MHMHCAPDIVHMLRLDAAVLDGITAGREAAKEGPSEAQCMGALLHEMLTRGTETPSKTPARNDEP